MGETILRIVMAYRAVEAMTTGIGPSEAAQQTIRTLESRTGGQGGIILVDAKGSWATRSTPRTWRTPT